METLANPETLATVKARFRANIKTKIGRRRKFSIAIEWPGCMNSGAEVVISTVSLCNQKITYRVSCPADRKILKTHKPTIILRDRYGCKRAYFECATKAEALTKMLAVAKPILESYVRRANDQQRAKQALKAGRPDLAAHYMMDH